MVAGAITESVSSMQQGLVVLIVIMVTKIIATAFSMMSMLALVSSQPGEAAVLGLVGGPAVQDGLHDVAVELVPQLGESWDELVLGLHPRVWSGLWGGGRRLQQGRQKEKSLKRRLSK